MNEERFFKVREGGTFNTPKRSCPPGTIVDEAEVREVADPKVFLDAGILMVVGQEDKAPEPEPLSHEESEGMTKEDPDPSKTLADLEELRKEAAKKEAIETQQVVVTELVKVGSKWDCDPADLENKSVDELNIMIVERDPDFATPYETAEEAIAHLTGALEN